MKRRSRTGYGAPCPRCNRPMMGSTSGLGWCVSCGSSIRDMPLVPIDLEPNRFAQLRARWVRENRDFNDDTLKWRRYLAPDGRVVTEKRGDPSEVPDEVLIHLPPPLGGRRRKRSGDDAEVIRAVLAVNPSATVAMITKEVNAARKKARKHDVSQQTVLRVMKDFGISRKKKSPRRT